MQIQTHVTPASYQSRDALTAQLHAKLDLLDKLFHFQTAVDEMFEVTAAEMRGLQAQLSLLDDDSGRVAA